MSRKAAAGGPQVYLSKTFAATEAALNNLLPELDNAGTTVAPAGTNETQQVALTGSPTGGDFTLTFGGETTGAIAFDAAAAAVQSALEALSSIGAGNVAVTGSAGGPWDVTFQGDLAATDVAMMTKDETGLTGGTSPDVSISETQKGGIDNWVQIPAVTNELVIATQEEAEDVMPLHLLAPTEDVITRLALGTVSFQMARRDLVNLSNVIEFSALTQVAAGASQVGKDELLYGSGFQAQTYRHAMLIGRNDLGYWTVWVFPKVRVQANFEITLNHAVTRIPQTLKCFAHDGLADDRDLLWVHDMTAVKTS